MIKSKLSFRVKSIFMTTVLIIGLLAVNVSAGSNVTITSMLTQSGEFNSTDWFVPNDDLEFENNSLNFTEDGNEETRLISKTIATKDDSFENLLNVNARIKISGIPQGKSFILAVGLSSIDSLYSEAGNVEMHFKNNSGLTADIMAFDEDGKSTDIVSGKRCGISLNSYADVNLVISNGGVLKISVNGQGIIDTKLPFVPEGRIGILQNAQCVASVSKLEMTTYSYDRPENVNVKEDFESGYINANAFTSKMINSARTYNYSNFEISFDVPFILREYVYDDDGMELQVPNGEFGISFGDVAADVSGQDYQQSTDLILFTGSGVSGWFSNWKTSFADKNFYKPQTNEGYSVKMTVIDGDLTLYMKDLSDASWQEMAKHSYSKNKPGSIKIWSTRDTNIAFDNICISNLDSNANLIEN